jgi:alpha-L-fucosidase
MQVLAVRQHWGRQFDPPQFDWRKLKRAMLQDWFVEAKYGIFLHWGIYSAGDWGESWPFFNGEVSYETYMAQAQSFTAQKYDPDAWARLFAESGARYAVLTAKHHDGFALWPTQVSSLNAVEGSPAGRDLIGPYCDALRRHGLKVGIYYSHLDWSHPDYASVLPGGAQPHDHSNMHSNPFGYPQNGPDEARWEKFLAFHRAQLKELCTLYKPDLLWFDGDWERDPEQWRFAELRDQLHEWAPGVVLNSRMGGHGDYGTPEQAIPITAPDEMWEFCVTTNDHWGYVKSDNNWKTPRQCIRMLAECAGMGGNLLLDIGPKSDGTIPDEQADILRQIGRWTHKHGEALYATVRGLPAGHFYGASTLSPARDTLYLFLFDRPYDEIAVKGIRNAVKSVEVVGSGQALQHRVLGGAPWAHLPGVLWIEVPEGALDSDCTVLKVQLDGPLDLYSGAGDVVTLNV